MTTRRGVLARISLKARINLLVSGLLGSFAIGLVLLALQDARSSVREEIEAANKVTHQLLRFVVEREMASTRNTRGEGLVAIVRGLGRVRAQEISVIAPDGSLAYTSPPSPYKAGRDAPAWFARLLAPATTAWEVPVGDMVLHVRPNPSRAVLDAWDDLLVLFGGLAVLLVLANLLLHRLVSRSLGEMQQVISAMGDMAQGRLDARIPQLAVPELERLRSSFNAMASALEASRKENRQLAHDQALARAVQERLDAERRGIARELHDELGQCVTAIRAIALSIAGRAEQALPQVHGSALSIASVAGSMYDAVHAIVARLQPAVLARQGLAEGLREWLRGWQANHPGRELRLDIASVLGEVPPAVELAVLRIVQEALSNAVRHGEARHVAVRLGTEGARLVVRIEDDGCGFAAQELPAGHFGLSGMRDRASELGGVLEIDSQPGAGTRVRAEFPLCVAAAEGSAPTVGRTV
jgi:two-component system sensor histidine kinase UhpB